MAQTEPKKKPKRMLQRSEGSFQLARLGLTQRVIAEKIGVEASTVNRWISGKTRPTKTQRKLIEQEFGIARVVWDETHAKGPTVPPTKPSSSVDPLAESKLAQDLLATARQHQTDAWLQAIARQIAEIDKRANGAEELTALERYRRLDNRQKAFEQHLERLRSDGLARIERHYEDVLARITRFLKPLRSRYPEVDVEWSRLLDDVAEIGITLDSDLKHMGFKR